MGDIELDKESLRNYADLQYEIYRIQKRISKLKNTIEHDSVKASNLEFPYQPISVRIEGTNVGRISRLERILMNRLGKAESQQLEVEEFISSIRESRVRMIFEDRYIHGRSWQSISRRFGSNHESYARNIHDRYLAEMEL